MTKIAVVTDSTALIPPETAKELDIHVVPLHLLWDQKVYRDGIDIQPDEFFKRLRHSPTLPTTSGAIQAEFISVFEKLRGKVDGIVAFTVSSKLSAAYNSALLAKGMFEDMRIEIIDTLTSTIGMGFGVIAAARAAAEGASMENVISAAKPIFRKVRLLITLDTLDFLRRGGRISFPAAVMAKWLRVKPILSLGKDGTVAPVARPVTKSRAREMMLKMMEKSIGKRPLHIGIMHADAPEEAELLRKEILSRFNCVELLMRPFTPIMGAHTGPGLVGFAGYSE